MSKDESLSRCFQAHCSLVRFSHLNLQAKNHKRIIQTPIASGALRWRSRGGLGFSAARGNPKPSPARNHPYGRGFLWLNRLGPRRVATSPPRLPRSLPTPQPHLPCTSSLPLLLPPSWRPAAGFPSHHFWRKGVLPRAATPRMSEEPALRVVRRARQVRWGRYGPLLPYPCSICTAGCWRFSFETRLWACAASKDESDPNRGERVGSVPSMKYVKNECYVHL